MSNDNNASGVTDETGSASDESTQTKTVNPKDHARAVEDLKKFKGLAKEHETNFQKLQAELEEIKNGKLKEQNDFKALYEKASGKNSEWEQKYGKLKESVVYNEKYKAAQTALLTAGVRKEALKILDKEALDEIVVEHTSEGRMLVSGVDEYVDSFKKNYGFAFEDKKQTKVNGGGGGSGGNEDGTITPAKLYELEKKHGVRSEEYLKAVERYRKQKQG